MRKKKDLLEIAFAADGKALKTRPQSSVNYRAQLEWKDGIPYLASAPVRVSEAPMNVLPALLKLSLDLPYDGENPALEGLSNGEAMMIQLSQLAAEGDLNAINTILDRILGRAQQNIKSVSLSGNLNDFLDKVAEETRETTIDVVAQASDENEGVEDL